MAGITNARFADCAGIWGWAVCLGNDHQPGIGGTQRRHDGHGVLRDNTRAPFSYMEWIRRLWLLPCASSCPKIALITLT